MHSWRRRRLCACVGRLSGTSLIGYRGKLQAATLGFRAKATAEARRHGFRGDVVAVPIMAAVMLVDSGKEGVAVAALASWDGWRPMASCWVDDLISPAADIGGVSQGRSACSWRLALQR